MAVWNDAFGDSASDRLGASRQETLNLLNLGNSRAILDAAMLGVWPLAGRGDATGGSAECLGVAGEDYIRSVSRALDILEFVANSATGLRLHSVAGGLGLHRQTAYKILKTLVHKGFLEKTPPPGRYKLGPILMALRNRQDRWNREFLLPSVAKAIGVSRMTSADVIVCQYVGGSVVGRFIARGQEPEKSTALYGYRMASYGIALTFLAHLDKPELDDYRASHPFSEEDAEFWKSHELLDAFLHYVRQEGYLALVKGRTFRASAPSFDRSGAVASVLALVRRIDEMGTGDAQKCIDLVRRAAKEVPMDTPGVGGPGSGLTHVE